MTYRNITVDGQTYQYVIGKKFTKVVGVGIVANNNLGVQVSNAVHLANGRIIGKDRCIITPADIRRMILGNGEVDPHFHDGPHTCGCGKTGDDVKLRPWPFDLEIYDKRYYAYICDDCCEKNADDI